MTQAVRGRTAGGIGEKFNNIQTRIFREVPGINEPSLIQALKKFLVPAAG